MLLRSTGPWLLGTILVTLAPGCGGDGIHHASVSSAPMPAGETFTGVWHSPQYGEMHITQTGAQVIGDYTQDERHGRIQGTAQGNVLRFEWSEERELISGHPTTTRGHGYFQFQIGDDGDSYILGNWGHDENETGGGPWNAVRDRRRRPHAADGSAGGDTGTPTEELEDLGPSSGSGSGTGTRSDSVSSDLDGL